jgi:hypothetical protein
MISVPMFQVIDTQEETAELYDYNAVVVALAKWGYSANIILDAIATVGEIYLPDGFWIKYAGDAELPTYTFLMF